MCAERNVYLLRPPGVPLSAHHELYNNFIAPDAVLLLVGYWPWGGGLVNTNHLSLDS